MVGLVAAGCFSENKDPFFCRRAAYAIIDIILHHKYPLDLHHLTTTAAALQPIAVTNNHISTVKGLLERRLQQTLTDEWGIDIDVARAVVSARGLTPHLAAKTAVQLAPVYQNNALFPFIKSFSRCLKIAKDYQGE